MEQNCTPKIVSLHMEPCSYDCPNVDVCYHRRKNISKAKAEEILPTNFRVEMLKKGYILHESICSEPKDWIVELLSKYKNYNITIPYPLATKEVLAFPKQLQLTVHTREQAKNVIAFQKLYLVKSDESFNYMVKSGLWNIPFLNTHFCIDQNWVTQQKLQEIFYYRMLSNAGATVTIDSCAESWIINGRCPYNHGNYVDITFDGTLRTCPFNRTGVPLTEVFDGSYESLFKVKQEPEQCKYSEWFTEKINGESNNTSIQDNSTDNQD